MTQSELHLSQLAAFPDVDADAVAFSVDGTRWAVAGAHQLHTGSGAKLVGTFAVPGNTPHGSLAFSADGAHVRWGATAFGVDAALALSPEHDDARARQALAAELPSRGGVDLIDAVSSPDGQLVVALGRTRPAPGRSGPVQPQRAAVVAIRGGVAKVLAEVPVSDAPGRLLLRGDKLVVLGAKIALYDVGSGARVFEVASTHVGSINAAAIDDAGSVLFTAGADGAVSAWSLDGKHRFTTKVASDPLRAISFDAGQHRVLVTGWDDRVHAVAASDGAARGSMALGAHGEALAVSVDGRQVLVGLGGARAELRLYEIARP